MSLFPMVRNVYTLLPNWYEQMLDGSLNFSVTLLVFEYFGMCFKNEFKTTTIIRYHLQAVGDWQSHWKPT